MKTMEELDKELEQMRKIADKNIAAEKLRKDGKIDEAKKLLEENIRLKADTPATYRNLAIIYRNEKDKENEIRVLKDGLKYVNPNNKKHYKWIKDRLSKIK